MKAEIEAHESANIFPYLTGNEFLELKNDIKNNGIQVPITIFQGKILDGRNRYKAAFQLIEDGFSVDVPFEEFEGDEDQALKFVISTNLHRRHLNESQRAMIAGRIATLGHGGNRSKIEIMHNTTVAEASKTLNVSERSVKRGKKVLEGGSNALIDSVDTGRVAVTSASEIAELERDEQERILQLSEKEILEKAKEIRAKKAAVLRSKRIEKIQHASAGNTGLNRETKYPILYADPPWQYEFHRSVDREIENHYPTMTLDEIKALPILEIATDPAVLFLWVTSPKLEEGLEVMTAWGFEYRSSFVWVKHAIGMGMWCRVRHEYLLIGKRGDFPIPEEGNRFDSVIEADRRAHSQKPHVVYDMIEKMYPEFSKIELFARNTREGWQGWGNQYNVEK